MTLGAQARHMVTYSDTLTVPLFTPFKPKSVKNGQKRGYPLFLTTFGKISGARVPPPTPGWPLGGPNRPHFAIQVGRLGHLGGFF